MGLQGTIRDLGLADVFQLLVQGQKSGVLSVAYRHEQVKVYFKDGTVARAETSARKKNELIGMMLVRAELITETQLQHALEDQRRTLQKLGETLVRSGALSAALFRQMLVLQTTELIFRLFSWKRGKYDFRESVRHGEVELDPEYGPSLRTELVLMEGLAQLEEWPRIRRRIPRYGMTFERVGALPAEGGDGQVGPAERMVHSLLEPGRDVRRLIELSRLGEFECCKALSNLLELKLLRSARSSGSAGWVGREGRHGEELSAVLGRWLLWVGLLTGLAFGVSQLEFGELTGMGSAPSAYSDPALQRLISRAQLSRIEARVDLYRLEAGSLPPRLDALVEKGLLAEEDLKYPWKEAYYYRPDAGVDGRFILLPPLR